MAAPRRSVDLRMTEEEVEQLGAIARSRTEAACRVTRARMLLHPVVHTWSYKLNEAA